MIFGDADPEGWLTQTRYRSACEPPDLLDYDIVASDATYRYYRYYRGEPFFPDLPVPRAGRYDLTEVRAGLADVRGIRDLYMVFENAGITLAGLTFGERA
ncbi:hypothetical protein [Streptosporangium sandarakinum]